MKKGLFAAIALLLCAGMSSPASLAQSAADTTETITPIEEVRRGASVTLQGTVTRILDEDTFRLEDETGSIRVYIGWRNRVPAEVGESVTVRGIVDDDRRVFARPEVYAQELVLEDGAVVELRNEDAG